MVHAAIGGWLGLAILAGWPDLIDPARENPNVGRFDFSERPDRGIHAWNLNNLEWPEEALTIEDLGEGNRGLRVGRATQGMPGSLAGRYTITLRASTHDWDPSAPGAVHVVSLRYAAQYTGAALFAVSSPGGGGLVDIGGGTLKVWQTVNGENQMVDETAAVQAALDGKWNAADLHTYTLRWRTPDEAGPPPFELRVDGQLVRTFTGHSRPLDFDPTLEISFENGAGTGVLDFVEWKINDGKVKPMKPFVVEKGVRQLFLDDEGVEGLEGLRRVVNQPTRHPENPVVQGEYPWEKASTSVYGTALFDEAMGRFRLWYLCTPGPLPSGRKWVEVGGYRRVTNCTLVGYATSLDGIHWEKPFLNQLSFEGSTENNLVKIGIDNPEGISILFDPQDPDPARRYKAFFWDRRVSPPGDPSPPKLGGMEGGQGGVNEGRGGASGPAPAPVPQEPPGLTPAQAAGGLWVAFSPDGLTWQTHGPVLPQGSDTTQAVVYDPKINRYVAFGRFGFGRNVARTESEDFLHWTEPKLVLTPDAKDGPAAQIYGMPTDLYEGLYLGMFWIYREGTDGKIDTQLAVSRDGLHWKRVADRQTFLPNAPDGARDDGMSRVVGRYIVRGDTIYLYYSMVNGPHRGPKFPTVERKFPPAIGLVTLRRDGFVSLDAGEEEGRVLTRPFVLPDGDLYVNVDVTPPAPSLDKGGVRVTVCDEAGRPWPGFENSQPLTVDSTRARVEWTGANLGSLRGRTVRLGFTVQRGKLFSYWLE